MNIKISTTNNIDLLLDLRMEFMKEIHPEYSIEQMNNIKIGTYQFISEQIENNTYAGFLGKIDEIVVCSASLLTYFYPPLFCEKNRKIGYVINFYTKKQYRKCGYGMQLMEQIKSYGRENDFYKIILTASEEGYSLYKKSGFIDAVRNMEYKVDK